VITALNRLLAFIQHQRLVAAQSHVGSFKPSAGFVQAIVAMDAAFTHTTFNYAQENWKHLRERLRHPPTLKQLCEQDIKPLHTLISLFRFEAG
jgi:hypothetical protein